MYQEGTTGTLASTNAGVATTIDCRNFRTGLIAIRNLGGANTITYTIDGYANYAGVTAGIADKTITDIAPNATATFSFDGVTRAIRIITVAAKVGGAQSNFVIEHCLGL
jgi:hypothetical protein